MTAEVKTYLLAVNDLNMALLNRVMPGITYVEVKGMPLADNTEFMALTTPLPKQAAPEAPTPDVVNEAPVE